MPPGNVNEPPFETSADKGGTIVDEPVVFVARDTHMRHMRKYACSVVLLLAVAGCGTDWGYALTAVVGQLNLLQNTIPIDQAVATLDLTAEQRSKLALIQDVRLFARDRVGLNIENYYTTYYDAGDRPVAINLSAARKDRLEPKFWNFPFVGDLPYLGFFDPAAARARADELERDGWDVFLYEIDAYSIGTFAENPVLSTVLRRDEFELADLVVHELLHATIFRLGDIAFNEQLATFVGRTAAIQFYARRFPDDPDRLRTARNGLEDADRWYAFGLEFYRELETYYAGEPGREARIAGREAIFQSARDRFVAEVRPLMHAPERFDRAAELPTNNAFILGLQRYQGRLDVFDRVFDAAGGSWPVAMALFRRAADHQGDPYEFLIDQAAMLAPDP